MFNTKEGVKLTKDKLTKDEDRQAIKQAKKRLDEVLPRGRKGLNYGRGPKYQELLKEERERIKREKRKGMKSDHNVNFISEAFRSYVKYNESLHRIV
jgi:hypothetical protein